MRRAASSSCKPDRKWGSAMAETNRLSIGNQTAFFAPVLEPFLFAVEHGFDAFELFPDGGPFGRGWSADEVTATERAFLCATARDNHVRLSIHAALDSGPIEGPARTKLLHDIHLARDIGARVVNIHLAHGAVEAYCRATLSLVDELEPWGIMLALENTVFTGPENVNRVFACLQALDAERAHAIGLCLDIGHANLHHATHNDYLAYLDGLGAHVPIVHGHLHENWGDSDKHLTLFTGPASRDPSGIVGLLRRLQRRNYTGSLILEQWPAPPTLLVTARDRLLALQAQENAGGGP